MQRSSATCWSPPAAMSDKEDAAAVKRSNDRWVVVALTISAFLLAWLLKRQLDAVHEATERYDAIDRELDGNLPKERLTPLRFQPPPGFEAALISVLNSSDGSFSVRFDGASWSLPAADEEGHEIARQRLQDQLKERLTAYMAAHELHRVEIFVDPPPRKEAPAVGTMLALDIVLAAGFNDIAFASNEVPEVPR